MAEKATAQMPRLNFVGASIGGGHFGGYLGLCIKFATGQLQRRGDVCRGIGSQLDVRFEGCDSDRGSIGFASEFV